MGLGLRLFLFLDFLYTPLHRVPPDRLLQSGKSINRYELTPKPNCIQGIAVTRLSESITFRADSDLAQKIDAAREAFGISRSDWVRGAIINHFRQSTPEDLNLQFVDLRQTLTHMDMEASRTSAQLKRVTFMILTIVGRVSADEAKAIVRKVFKE